MSDTAKHRADRCTTHHYACDCREYLTSKRIAELEAKLERLESKWSFVYRTGDVMDNLSESAKNSLSVQDVSYVLDAIHRTALEGESDG